MRSIRSAILSRLLLGTLALLLLGTLGLYAGVRSLLTAQFDEILKSKFATLATRIEQEGARVEFDFFGEYMPEFQAEMEPEYFQLWVKDGSSRSRSLGETDLPKEFGTEAEPRIWDLKLPDGRRGRALGARFPIQHYLPGADSDPGPETVAIVVARGRRALDGALAALVLGSAIGSLLLVLASLWLGTQVVDRGLRPVAALVAHVEAIEDPTQAGLFQARAAPLEIRPIAEGVNHLVERIGRMLERERRTSANIAHELRTPISELLVLSGVALRCGDEPGHLVQALEQVQEVSLQMRRLVTTLLELSRFESGRIPLEDEPIELAALLDECWEPLAERARAKELVFERRGASGLVNADRGALSILLGNLLGNAVDYTPGRCRIDCEVKTLPGACELWISNPAADLRSEDLDKLTEPFWRASAAREDRAHAGLGLALASRLAELLRAELNFELQNGTFRASVRFHAGTNGAAGGPAGSLLAGRQAHG